MNTQKWGALAIYAAMAACLLLLPGSQAAQVILWIFIALAVIHILEFVIMFRLLSAAPGSLVGHFVHTLFFGYVHWLPIKRQQTP